MIYVLYVFAGLFIALALAMLYVYYRERHIGMFLMGVAYGTAGALAIMVSHWWPLVAGFVLVWMLKMLGLEMEPRPLPEESAKTDPDQGEMREGEGGSRKSESRSPN